MTTESTKLQSVRGYCKSLQGQRIDAGHKSDDETWRALDQVIALIDVQALEGEARAASVATTESEKELLPCPHCGFTAHQVDAAGEHWIRCDDGCTDMTSDEDRAIAAWNRRAAVPSVPSAELAALSPLLAAAWEEAHPDVATMIHDYQRRVCELLKKHGGA